MIWALNWWTNGSAALWRWQHYSALASIAATWMDISLNCWRCYSCSPSCSYALRLSREFNLADLVGAGLMLGAVAYTSLSLTLVTLLGWIALLVLVWTLGRGESSPRARWALTFAIPGVAVARHRPLAGQQSAADLADKAFAFLGRPKQSLCHHA